MPGRPAPLRPPFDLATERLGPLPLLNAFLERIGLPALLERHVPTRDPRRRLPYARALGVLLRSILVEREPIYRHQETVSAFAPSAFGLAEEEAHRLRDDALGRALDRLFDADRGALLTAVVVVVAAVRRFGVRLEELHNDTTSIRFCGQYRGGKGRSLRGKRPAWITYGYSKDHRPDLKQLLFVLSSSADGGIPLQFRCEDGNTNDTQTHVATWEALREAAGRADFLYVADSKLCTYDNLDHIDRHGGRFVTVLPRSRAEDAWFRKWIQKNEPAWEMVWDRPHPRRRHGPRDRWWTFRPPLPSREGWPLLWVKSALLALHQQEVRGRHLAQAEGKLAEVDAKLAGKRPRLRSRKRIQEVVDEILRSTNTVRWLRVEVWRETLEQFKQEHRGRPGPETRYRKLVRKRWRVRWRLDEKAVAYDQKSDRMYPLLTNDRELTAQQVLEAHKRQPVLEKRFEQIKTVHEIAPVLLKNPGRVEALFFLYFLALLVQALVERELRRAMADQGIEELPIYPEERACRKPTAQRVLRLFGPLEQHTLRKGDQVVQVFHPRLTPLQEQVLGLLGVSRSADRTQRGAA